MTLAIIQNIVAVAIVALVLLQERSSGLSSIFGGEGGFYQTRRGLERVVFYATIVLTLIFLALAVVHLVRS